MQGSGPDHCLMRIVIGCIVRGFNLATTTVLGYYAMYNMCVCNGEGGQCIHMVRYGAYCCDYMNVFIIMYVCGCVGVQLGGKCCYWPGNGCILCLVSSVTGWLVCFTGVCTYFLRKLVLLYNVRIYAYVMLFYV